MFLFFEPFHALRILSYAVGDNVLLYHLDYKRDLSCCGNCTGIFTESLQYGETCDGIVYSLMPPLHLTQSPSFLFHIGWNNRIIPEMAPCRDDYHWDCLFFVAFS